VIVENRAGAGGNLGAEAVFTAAPDGYTLLFTAQGPLVVNKSLYEKLNYDPEKFTPVSLVMVAYSALLANPKVPAESLQQLIAYAKANPDKLQIATDGPRRFSGLIAAWINKLAGTNISYVPYVQMTQGIQDVLTGRVQLIILAVPAARGHITAGKLNALAVTSAKRLDAFPDVATVAETFPGFDFAGWWVLAAPAGVPAPILERVNRELDAILKSPDVVERLRNIGFLSRGGGTMQQTRDYVQAQYLAWGKLVKEIGLQPE
jgi:tripartite-type tricarboxylate transporter receptor subunit TctC